ncbi:MAG: AAA family ATPase [Defluviitaleaceae bacterium]|nr:AAA family ATPase [Defluviitaleaceae bacterium]
MVLKRKAYKQVVDWKNKSNGKTALLLNGARRVGKSFLAEHFGKNEYKSMILIDFSNPPKDVISIFENDSHDIPMFLTKLSLYYQVKLHVRDSLIVFDEVQIFPKARQLIKHLVADGRYDYMESGSLLSLKENVKDILIPSEEEEIEIHPLDFEEFLLALDDEVTVSFARECFEQRKPLGQAIHQRVMNNFRTYMLVGGMPQAVIEYAASKDFEATDHIKRNILSLYRRDIAKYAGAYKGKVTAIYDNLPGQLSKKEKKYKLSSIDKNARFRAYEDAFMWLADGMIVNPCYNATDPSFGLSLSMDYTTQKIYMADTGLLVSHAFRNHTFTGNELYKAILFDKLNVNEGMLMENVVSQMLRVNGHRLFFYSRVDRAKRENHMEIDFLITHKNKISPLEVKSSSYKKHSSLDKFMNRFKPKLSESFILYQKDLSLKDNVIHLPIYMAMFL